MKNWNLENIKKEFNPNALPFLTIMPASILLLCRVWLRLLGIDQRGLYISGHFADIVSYLLLAFATLAVWVCVRNVNGGGKSRGLFPASLSVILPVCIVTIAVTAFTVGISWTDALPYLPGSALGGILAGKYGHKIPVKWLHRGLGLLILWGGWRYLWQ